MSVRSTTWFEKSQSVIGFTHTLYLPLVLAACLSLHLSLSLSHNQKWWLLKRLTVLDKSTSSGDIILQPKDWGLTDDQTLFQSDHHDFSDL